MRHTPSRGGFSWLSTISFVPLSNICAFTIPRIPYSVIYFDWLLTVFLLPLIRHVSVKFFKPPFLIICSKILNCLFLILIRSVIKKNLPRCSHAPSMVSLLPQVTSSSVRKLPSLYRRIDMR